MFTRRLPVRALLVLLAVVGFAAVLYASHAWGSYHWARTSNPFTLKLGDNVSGTWDTHLFIASNDWSQSSVLNTTVVAGSTRPKNCRPTSGRVEVCAASYGNNGWLGIAQIWVSGSHITQGTVKNNDYYFNQPQYNSDAWRQFVMCQEIGHTFGLGHTDENFNNANQGTCMDYTNDPDGGAGGASNNDPSNEHPNQHDYQQLESIYAHLDSTTTVGFAANQAAAPPAMNQVEMEGPGQWGRLVRGSREQGTSLYELDFGGGRRVFTFVIWARENGQHE